MKKDKKEKQDKKSEKRKEKKELKRSISTQKSGKKQNKKKIRKSKKEKKVTVSAKTDYRFLEESQQSEKLTVIEKLKLIRNCAVLLVAIAAILIFLKDSIDVSREIDLIVIFSTIIFTLLAFLLFVFCIKCMQDIKNGSVNIFKGTVQKGSDDILYSAYLPICMIILDRKVHHVGLNHYLKIKNNDFIILRRTPVTRCIVNLKIKREEK